MEGGQKEAEYASKEADSVSFGIFGLFLEVARDISSVFREVIQEVEYVSGIKDTLSQRPNSPDMFESEEEDGNENPVDELPSTSDPGPTLLLSHLPENKRAAEASSNTSPTKGKRKKKVTRKTKIEVNLFLLLFKLME